MPAKDPKNKETAGGGFVIDAELLELLYSMHDRARCVKPRFWSIRTSSLRRSRLRQHKQHKRRRQ